MRLIKSFRVQILLAMLGIGLVTATAFSMILYQVQTSDARHELIHTAEAVLRPILALATRGVDGGNLMKLRGKDATSLYKASEILYLDISGTSRGTPKSAFSKALPPKPIRHTYLAEGVDKKLVDETLGRLSDAGGVDETNWLYVVRAPLPDVKNGGQITAVFSAETLKGVVWRTLKSVALVSLLMLVAVSLTALLIGRYLSRPVAAIASGIRDISESLDLSRRVDVDSGNEIGDTAKAFNALVERLQGLIGQVDTSAVELNRSVDSINHASHQAATRVRAQEQETEKVSTAMANMVAMVERVASRTDAANDSARGAEVEAVQGQQVVADTLAEIEGLAQEVECTSEVIRRLSDEAQNIGGVLDVIRGIAEQTNLLALNAAIEAARAGESGRGFAVVADEVRTLAQRTQQATEEINAMIQRLQQGAVDADQAIDQGLKKVASVVKQSKVAGNSLQTITEAANRISEMNSDIASSVRDQAHVAEEINHNLLRINELTEEAAREIGGTAESSDRLTDLAQRLTGLVSQFKV